MSCCENPDVRKDKACNVCIKCGQTSGQTFYNYVFSEGVQCKGKAVHSRIKWFKNMIMEYVKDDDDRERLCSDFQTLVKCYEDNNLLPGRNMSIYGFYIDKLARRRNIPLLKQPREIKTKAKRFLFNDRYRKACKILGW